MEFRSHTQGASSKGKEKITYVDSSDEDEYGVMKPDSGYEGEDLFDWSEGNGRGLPFDLNSLEINNEDFHCNLATKRKTSSSKSSVEESLKVQLKQDEENREMDIDIKTGEYTEPFELVNSQVLLEKPGSKKKSKKNIGDKRVLIWEDIEEEQKKWVAENWYTLIDLNQSINEIGAETVEPSDDLTVPLLRYQKEWLAWALNQENSPIKGGILADEMGMGKTLEAIALVLLKRKISREIYRHEAASSSCFSDKEPRIKRTLVVCPLVAVMQWVDEIDRFTSQGSTKVLVYHGANRAKKCNNLSEYDIVITTYSIVEAEYRKCGKCHNDGMKPDSGGEKEMEIPPQGKPILHSVIWERIILDEAHYIKGEKSKTTTAVLGLISHHKWALSGTPLNNRVGEIYSLVRFLRMYPFSYCFCNDCDCCAFDDRNSTTLVCMVCSHRTSRHFSWWNKYIALPIRDSVPASDGKEAREAMLLLKNRILKCILLRRTKMGRATDLSLPPKIVTVRRDTLDAVEEDYYRLLYYQCQRTLNDYAAENIAGIFFLLTRLRLTLDHPYLVEYSHALNKGKPRGRLSDVAICQICHYSEGDVVVTSCGHVFCKPCLINYGIPKMRNTCPSCSEPITIDLSPSKYTLEPISKKNVKGFRASSILNMIKLDDFQTSTKIDALREEIRFMVERDSSAKGIVFSQFSSFLDLIRYALLKSGIECVQLDGSMTIEARDAAVKTFTEDRNCRIFLISLKAGGVALNLTAASHVFMMEPWWNPAMEQQAQDRVHRIGQCKPVHVVKFIVENTIEEKIMALQEKKELLYEGALDESSDALSKIIEEGLNFLLT